ncbi:hypothetical protein [uncultured Nocardioides sp.]|uniref:hypothetical protein n=1 Tax=uncultured Nocardioides sp. TaxID=198441 RepID=UPI00262E43D1|nr:hypothetical protein [uncultured Nocardioides sp.]HRD59364.1 hypothetical protein [Nocardioides sp.]
MKYYDPCSGTRTVKWRWRTAGWLNRLPRTCWANIVSWALGSRPIWDREMGDDIRRSPMCFEPGQERCYCGKFANPMREPVTTSESEQT